MVGSWPNAEDQKVAKSAGMVKFKPSWTPWSSNQSKKQHRYHRCTHRYPQLKTGLLLPLFYQHWPKVKIQKICKQGKLRSYLDANGYKWHVCLADEMRRKVWTSLCQWPSLEERIVISWNDSCRSYAKHPINEVQRIWGRLLEVSKPNSSRIWENMRRCKYVNIWN